MTESRGPFPAITIYYDNAGKLPARAVSIRYAAGFGTGLLTQEAMLSAQDTLLSWEGWPAELDRRARYEMHPGDPGEFTTIPNGIDGLDKDFRANFAKVSAGTMVLYIFIAFKYRDSSMSANTLGVTEDCFWFSGNFARHNCGRGRAFLESHE